MLFSIARHAMLMRIAVIIIQKPNAIAVIRGDHQIKTYHSLNGEKIKKRQYIYIRLRTIKKNEATVTPDNMCFLDLF